MSHQSTHTEIDPESGQFISNLDCSYSFPIDLALIRIPFDAKSIGEGKCYPNSVSFNQIQKRFLCVDASVITGLIFELSASEKLGALGGIDVVELLPCVFRCDTRNTNLY